MDWLLSTVLLPSFPFHVRPLTFPCSYLCYFCYLPVAPRSRFRPPLLGRCSSCRPNSRALCADACTKLAEAARAISASAKGQQGTLRAAHAESRTPQKGPSGSTSGVAQARARTTTRRHMTTGMRGPATSQVITGETITRRHMTAGMRWPATSQVTTGGFRGPSMPALPLARACLNWIWRVRWTARSLCATARHARPQARKSGPQHGFCVLQKPEEGAPAGRWSRSFNTRAV